MSEERKNPRLTGAHEDFDEAFSITSALLANLLFGKVTAARALLDQLDASLARIEKGQ